jgi:hypothetical protein
MFRMYGEMQQQWDDIYLDWVEIGAELSGLLKLRGTGLGRQVGLTRGSHSLGPPGLDSKTELLESVGLKPLITGLRTATGVDAGIRDVEPDCAGKRESRFQI